MLEYISKFSMQYYLYFFLRIKLIVCFVIVIIGIYYKEITLLHFVPYVPGLEYDHPGTGGVVRGG